MVRAGYFVKQALSHLGRSPAVATVTIATVAVVFLFLGLFAVARHNLTMWTEQLGNNLQLSVFLEDDCDPACQDLIRAQLAAQPELSQIQFVGREQALDSFRERLGPEAVILEELGETPLPASFEAALAPGSRRPEVITPLVQQIVNLAGVEEVQYGQDWLERFFAFARTTNLLGLIIGSLIVLASMVIVSNTIRLSVFARREEIHILKMMGATDRFIKAPFYIEGVLIGLTGSAVGTGLIWFLFALLIPQWVFPGLLSQSHIAVSFLPRSQLYLMVAGGGILGCLGTYFSLGRHLKI